MTGLLWAWAFIGPAIGAAIGLILGAVNSTRVRADLEASNRGLADLALQHGAPSDAVNQWIGAS